MIEPVTYWTVFISGIIILIRTLNELLKAIEELVERMKQLPNVLKFLMKFLTYSLTLVLPNIGIVWLFFYLAGSSPDRFSEPNFFWAMVLQPTLGVSIYAYIWGSWFYPQLKRILSDPTSKKQIEKEGTDHTKKNLPKKSKLGQRSNR